MYSTLTVLTARLRSPHRAGIAAAILLCTAFGAVLAAHFPLVAHTADFPVYRQIADAVRLAYTGVTPGPALTWYPPLTALVFLGVDALPGVSFAAGWLLFLFALVCLGTLYAFLRLSVTDALLVPAACLLTVLLLGPHSALSRFDLLVGVLFLLASLSFARGRRTESLWFVTAAAAVKLVPVLVLPLFFLGAARGTRRRLLLHLLLAVTCTMVLPAFVIGPREFVQAIVALFSFHGSRGVQVESTWSGLEMLFSVLMNREALIAYRNFAHENLRLGTVTVLLSVFTVLAGCGWLWWRVWRQRPLGQIAPLGCALLLWAMAAAPVLSPPYVAWVAPALLAWLLAAKTGAVRMLLMFLAVFVLLLTQWLYPPLYLGLLQGDALLPVLVLNLRNACLALLAAGLAAEGILRIPALRLQQKMQTAWRRIQPAGRVLFAPRTLRWLLLGSTCALAVLLGLFKVMDRDFWWHITAGRVMAQTWHLIAVEPFAYTRAGLPYVATHEWLAQILLFAVHALGGITGVILFRTAMIVLMGLALLWIDRERIHWNALVALLALTMGRAALLERPQLFSYLFFAWFIVLAFRFLETTEWMLRRRILLIFLLLGFLWPNLHGAAALSGAAVVWFLVCDEGWRWWNARGALSSAQRRQWGALLLTAVALIAAQAATPSGLDTVQYLYSLFTDQTTLFLREWLPRPFAESVADQWPLIAASVVSLALVRNAPVFSGLLLISTFLLARTAVRHEVLFVFAAAAVTIAQLRHSSRWRTMLVSLERCPRMALMVALTGVLLLTWQTQSVYQRYAVQDHLYGFGAFDLARGAADFLERTGAQGEVFNTYGIGGYLMHRWHPERKVFIDGRNVDYGFPFMMQTFLAGQDPAVWKELEERYGFAIALVDFNVVRDEGDISYARHLDRNPGWALVYIDDWVAVYFKDVPSLRSLIAEHRYSHITPRAFEGNVLVQEADEGSLPALEKELRRVAEGNPEGIKGRVELAKLLVRQGNLAEARVHVESALRVQPMRAEPYAVLAGIALAQGHAVEAAAHMSRMLALAGKNYPDLDYAVAANILDQGRRFRQAFWLRLRHGIPFGPPPEERAESSGPPSAPTEEEEGSPVSGLDLDFEPDIEQAVLEGIRFAEARQFDAAREAFLRALMYDPGRPSTLSNLCALELDASRVQEALEYCERALDRGADLPAAHYNLALVLLQLGRQDDARQHADEVERLGGDTKQLRFFIDQSLQGQ